MPKIIQSKLFRQERPWPWNGDEKWFFPIKTYYQFFFVSSLVWAKMTLDKSTSFPLHNKRQTFKSTCSFHAWCAYFSFSQVRKRKCENAWLILVGSLIGRNSSMSNEQNSLIVMSWFRSSWEMKCHEQIKTCTFARTALGFWYTFYTVRRYANSSLTKVQEATRNIKFKGVSGWPRETILSDKNPPDSGWARKRISIELWRENSFWLRGSSC